MEEYRNGQDYAEPAEMPGGPDPLDSQNPYRNPFGENGTQMSEEQADGQPQESGSGWEWTSPEIEPVSTLAMDEPVDPGRYSGNMLSVDETGDPVGYSGNMPDAGEALDPGRYSGSAVYADDQGNAADKSGGMGTGKRQGHLDMSYREDMYADPASVSGDRPVRRQGHLDSSYRYPDSMEESGGANGRAAGGAGQAGQAGTAGGAGQAGQAGTAGGTGQAGQAGTAGGAGQAPGGSRGSFPGGPGASGTSGAPYAQPPRKKKAGRIIPLVIFAVIAAVGVLLRPTGWSKEDARKGTQAYLDYYFKGDDQSLAKYMNDTTEEELAALREETREELISTTFKPGVPVTDDLRVHYADFYLDLMTKARYTVGEAVRVDDGFEVPVSVEPILSLGQGEHVRLDMQLNDNLSDEDLNERVYTQELEAMEKLAESPAYGEPEEVVMHISDGEDGYVFSEDDLGRITDLYCRIDRHWTAERAGDAVGAVLSGIYSEDYAKMSEWTVATEEEIEEAFGRVFSKEFEKKQAEEQVAELLETYGYDEKYTMRDSIAERLSKADRSLLTGTKYEVLDAGDLSGDGERIEVQVRITPFLLEGLSEERDSRLAKELTSIKDVSTLMDRTYELTADLVEEVVADQKYADPQDHVIRLTCNENKSYEMDYDDLYMLFGISTAVGSGSDGEIRDSLGDAGDPDDKTAADSRTKTEDTGTAAAGSLTHAKDIPIRVRGKNFEFGKMTLQDILDMTGFSTENGGKSVEQGKLEWAEVESGISGVYITIYVENQTGKGTRNVKECNAYELFYNNFRWEETGSKDLISVGGIRVGDSSEDVLKVFGVPEDPEKMDEESIIYNLDDGDYRLHFFIREDRVVGFVVTSYAFF